MNEFNLKIRERFCDKLVNSFGEIECTIEEAEKFICACIKSYSGWFYSMSEDFTLLSFVIRRSKGKIKEKADSKAEIIFCNILYKNNIKFEFQKKIGPYKVDYLFDNNIILECDGPHHTHPVQVQHDKMRDSYIEKKGYKILRCDWDMVAAMTDDVIELLQNYISNNYTSISEHNDTENQ